MAAVEKHLWYITNCYSCKVIQAQFDRGIRGRTETSCERLADSTTCRRHLQRRDAGWRVCFSKLFSCTDSPPETPPMSTPGHWIAFLGGTTTAEPRAYCSCPDVAHSSFPIANTTIFHILSIYQRFSSSQMRHIFLFPQKKIKEEIFYTNAE